MKLSDRRRTCSCAAAAASPARLAAMSSEVQSPSRKRGLEIIVEPNRLLAHPPVAHHHGIAAPLAGEAGGVPPAKAPPYSASKMLGSAVPAFIVKIFEIFSSPRSRRCASARRADVRPAGNARGRGAAAMLQHGNYASFVRQLNMYRSKLVAPRSRQHPVFLAAGQAAAVVTEH